MDLLRRLVSKLTIVRAVAIALVCAVFLVGTTPALAAGSSSSPSKGAAQMNSLQETSEEAVKQEPRDLESTQSKAQEGINSVQGGADADKMYSSSGSRSSESIPRQIEDALENLTGDK